MQASAARRVNISGRVTDEDGHPVELATVNDGGLLVSTITNLKGEYSINLAYKDTIDLVFRMLGHETRRRQIVTPGDSVRLDVMLPTSGYAIQGVTVSGNRVQTGQMQQISTEGIRLGPSTGGASVESVISTQAGVSTHNEMSNQYNVRGGNFDENSVYVNGKEIMRPLLVRAGQQEGLSFINPDMVESISFSTGGFEARYGDRMSSVLDITYRTPERTEASATASLLGGSVYAGTAGPKASIMGSVRYKNTQYLLGTLDTDAEYTPSFLDTQVAAAWHPADGWKIGFIGNIADNNYRFTPQTRTTTFGTSEDAKEFRVYFDGWERDRFLTRFAAADITRDKGLGDRVTLDLSYFRSNEEETSDILGEYWLGDAGIESVMSIGSYLQHTRNYLDATVVSALLEGSHDMGHHNIRWGLGMRRERIRDNIREWEMRDSAGYILQDTYPLRSSVKMDSHRGEAFFQDTWRFMTPAGLFSLNAGLRSSFWSWNNELTFSPRASVGFIPARNEAITLRLATGVYRQAPFYKEVREITETEGSRQVKLNSNIKSQRSIQVVAGGDYDFQLFDRPFRFTVEGYYKKLDNLIPYDVDNVRLVYYGRNCANGYAVGIDTKLFGEFVPGTNSWVTFSLMRTEEKIDGRWYPRPTDQRYNLSIYFTDYFPGTDRWQMILKGALADGLPFGPSHTGREGASFRAPAYKRADIGISYCLFNEEHYGRHYLATRYVRDIWVGADCLNLYDMSNVASYFWVTDTGGTRYGVPNYLTGRQFNIRIAARF